MLYIYMAVSRLVEERHVVDLALYQYGLGLFDRRVSQMRQEQKQGYRCMYDQCGLRCT